MPSRALVLLCLVLTASPGFANCEVGGYWIHTLAEYKPYEPQRIVVPYWKESASRLGFAETGLRCDYSELRSPRLTMSHGDQDGDRCPHPAQHRSAVRRARVDARPRAPSPGPDGRVPGDLLPCALRPSALRRRRVELRLLSRGLGISPAGRSRTAGRLTGAFDSNGDGGPDLLEVNDRFTYLLEDDGRLLVVRTGLGC